MYDCSEYLKKNNNNLPQSITFTSDYRKVTLDLSEIMYIESRDREVWVYASDNRTFRNKTPISRKNRDEVLNDLASIPSSVPLQD